MSQGKTPSPTPTKPAKTPAVSAPRATNRGASGAFTMGAWWRRGISALLLVHLILIVAVPLAIMPPRSRLATTITSWVRPYLDIAQFSHGYGFFATEPGPSHLVEYQLEFSPKEGETRNPILKEFPDIKAHRPRLLYHRHFMLSEKLASYLQPQPVAPQRPSDDVLRTEWGAADWQLREKEYQQDLDLWRRQREIFDVVVKAYGQHLIAESDASLVRLHIKTHLIPPPEEIAKGSKLNDAGYYLVPPESEAQVAADEPAAGTQRMPEEVASPIIPERRVAIPGERR
ncbi:MAG: hypothetical protein K8T91_24560 [Planctomycetes bacterium]|nr:hypothetical protein [Planctomycetota bacterium]